MPESGHSTYGGQRLGQHSRAVLQLSCLPGTGAFAINPKSGVPVGVELAPVTTSGQVPETLWRDNQ